MPQLKLFGTPQTNNNSYVPDKGMLLALRMFAPPDIYRVMEQKYLAANPLDGSGSGGTGDNGGGSGSGSGLGTLPTWWQEWYNQSGKYGGIPPVQGLL